MNLQIEAIDAPALDSLIANAIPEGKTIEFKSALPGRMDSEKIEFLADVASFANSSGGHIFYGVREQGGVASEISGLPGIDPDAEILRLESMIRDGIEPRIPGVTSRAVRAQNGEFVIVIRIPNSWVAPHMIVFKQHSRFYSRNSAGKYALDVTELRAAFALTESVGQRVREFRSFRVGKIIARETPVSLQRNGAFVLHVIPISAFSRPHRDLIAEGASAHGLETFEGGHYDSWFNFDGVLVAGGSDQESQVNSYTQLFRDGQIEMVGVFNVETQKRRIIPSTYFEKTFIARTEQLLGYLTSRKVEPPIAVMLTLIGVQGFSMAYSQGYRSRPVDRDVLPVAEVLFTGEQRNVGILLRPCFDAVWNACGFGSSPNFNPIGEWKPEQ